MSTPRLKEAVKDISSFAEFVYDSVGDGSGFSIWEMIEGLSELKALQNEIEDFDQIKKEWSELQPGQRFDLIEELWSGLDVKTSEKTEKMISQTLNLIECFFALIRTAKQ